MPIAPRTILVYVGLDLIGDALMKMPFVHALRETFPDAHITWLAGKGKTAFAGPLAPLARGLIDEVIEDAGVGTYVSELLRRPLAGRHFDLVIDTQRRVLTTLILRRIACDVFVSGAADFLFSDRRPAGRYRKPKTMSRQLLDLIEFASGRPVTEKYTAVRAESEENVARRLLPDGPTYIGFVPGAGGRHKCWPRQHYIDAARYQAAQGRVPVIILGPNEEDWYPELRAAVPSALFPLQAAAAEGEKPSAILTIALAARLHVAVANDCGGGHLMAAGLVPLVSIWGPTIFEKAPPQTKTLIPILCEQFEIGRAHV